MNFTHACRRLVLSGRDYFFIILGMIVYAVGFTVFILPHQVVIGGMSGFGTLVYYFSGERIPVAAAMYGTNILLLLCAYRYLGKAFVYKTVFGASLLSLLIGMMNTYFTSRPPLVTDMTLSVLMGAMLCGVGIGVYFRHIGRYRHCCCGHGARELDERRAHYDDCRHEYRCSVLFPSV